MYPDDKLDGDKLDSDKLDDSDELDNGTELDDGDDINTPHVECVAPRWCWEYRECQSGACGVDFTRVIGPEDIPDDPDDDPIY